MKSKKKYPLFLILIIFLALMIIPFNSIVEAAEGITNDAPVMTPLLSLLLGQKEIQIQGAEVSAQIQAARDSADGSGYGLPITGAVVTYTKPTIGADTAGFFIQGEQGGPALFIAVDPTTLAPVPIAGDVVSFTITDMNTSFSLRQATAITDFSKVDSGYKVSGLIQNVSSAADLVTGLDNYESEIISLAGTVDTGFALAGTGFVSAQISTAGIPGDPNLKLRIPASLNESLNLESGCTFTLPGTPLWRFNTQTQPSAWDANDINVSSCPNPIVSGAMATTANSVTVTFNRAIDPLSVLSNGGQFTFDGGLTTSAAIVNGNTVVVTTSAQVPDQGYSVTVADTVTDIFGGGVSPVVNSADFYGYSTPADVIINEFNANITNGCDLIELRVIQGGSMEGFYLKERDVTTLITFTGLTVQTNDFIVIHLDSSDTTNCNSASSGNETASTSELSTSTYPENYDSAYDWWSSDTGLTGTDNVFTLYDNQGNIVDAVLTSDNPTGTAAAGSETQAGIVAAASEWEMVGGGVPVGGFIDDNFNAHAVQDLNGTGTTSTGTSIQRNTNTDTNTMDGWTYVNNATWGALNSGQSALP